jgi:hypothetical protein
VDFETFKIVITLISVAISMGFLISGLMSFWQYQQAGKKKSGS